MKRRSFLGKAATFSVGASAMGSGCLSDSGDRHESIGPQPTTVGSGGVISRLSFYSPASQVSPSGGRLRNGAALVRAEETAVCKDTNGSGAYIYPESAAPPLVSEDGSVVGFGSTEFVGDKNGGFGSGNEEFLLNLWDAKTDGNVVLWDEGHGQYWDLSRYSMFREYARQSGYTVRGTSEVESDLQEASGVVITSPSTSFSQGEIRRLSEFAKDGGAVFLFDQSDYQGHDETENLNRIAEGLGVDFRFNSDQVNDSRNNMGQEFVPYTSNFDASLGYFNGRDSGIKGITYRTEVTGVSDGDTVEIKVGSGSDTVRVLGIDTSETPPTPVKPEEWTGIDSQNHLREWADRASEFAEEKLSVGDTVEIRFDEEEPLRGEYGRLLSYVYYDSTGDGSMDTNYSMEAIRQGYARVYSSGFGMHDRFASEENRSIKSNKGVWSATDIQSLDGFRNDEFDRVFFPEAVGIEASDEMVAVRSEDSSSEPGTPLVGVDENARVAAVGGPIIHEGYEGDTEEFGPDTSVYGNYPLMTNLMYYLSDRDGNVFIEGGHGQFSTEGSFTKEDVAWYRRHLEGTGRRLRQVNSIAETYPDIQPASLIISPPEDEYSSEVVEAVSEMVEDGGSVVLVGSSVSDNNSSLNSVAEALGSDLRITGTSIGDPERHVGDEENPVTSDFANNYPFFVPA